MAYATRGFDLVVPTIAESQMTGWFGSAHFTRRGYDYRIRFARQGVLCERNDQPISWEALPSYARKIAHDAAGMLKQARSTSA